MNEKLHVVVQFIEGDMAIVSLARWEEHKRKHPDTRVKCLTEKPLPESVARKMMSLTYQEDNPDEHY